MNIDTRYIKVSVFAISLIFLVLVLKPTLKNVDNLQADVAVPPIAQQSSVIPNGDLSDNYISNALNAKGELTKWQNFPISVYIPNNPYKAVVETAFNNYNNVFAGLLSFSFVDNPSSAKIKVNFTDRIEQTESNQFVAGLTSTYNSGNNIQSAIINLLTQKNNIQLSSNTVYNTALHEIGHSIGIEGHSENPSDVMYSHASTNQAVSFSQRDAATIKIMYSNNQILLEQNKGNVGSQKLQEAIKYTQAVPDKTVGWVNLGNIYYDLKMLPEALEAYKKALSIDATDANIYSSMAACYYESKKYPTAAKFYGYAIERTSDTTALENYTAMQALSFLTGENFEAAYGVYNVLVSKYPKKDYMVNYLYLCAKLNKPEGKDVLINYLRVHPEDSSDSNFIQYKRYYRVQ